MPSWKKVITSGSNATLAQISASVVPTATTQNLLAIDSSTGGIMQITQSGAGGINTFKTTGVRTGDGFISGDVGIGTTAPNSRLNVKSAGSATDQITLTHSGNTVNIAEIGQLNSHGSLLLRGNNGTAKIQLSASGSHSYIQNDKNFGIGTTSPDSKLEVNMNDASGNRLGLTGDGSTTGAALWTNWTTGVSYLDFRLGGITDTYTKMRITNAGNVGIGTNSPSEKLEVDGNIKLNSGLKLYTGSSNYGQIIADSEGLNLDTVANRHLIFKRQGTETMRIDTSGNVGIGTTSPGDTLTIYNDNNLLLGLDAPAGNDAQLRFYSEGAYKTLLYRPANSDDFRISTVSGDALTIKQDKNVGIGITSPSAKLHISASAGSNLLQLTSKTSAGSTPDYKFQIADNAEGYATTFNMDVTGLDIGHNSDGRDINLKTADKDRLTIKGDGGVGIGITSPSYILDVSGSARLGGNESTATLHIQSTGSFGLPAVASEIQMLGYESRGQGIFFRDLNNPDKEWFAGVPYQNNNLSRYQIGYSSEVDGRAEYQASASLTIRNSGNVGIGTANPQSKLHITSPSASSTSLTIEGDVSNSKNIFFNSSSEGYEAKIREIAGTLGFFTGGDMNDANVFITSESGNVGIGTTTPGTINGVAFSGVGLHTKFGTLGRTITEGTSFAEFIMNHSGATADRRVKFIMSRADNLEFGSMDDDGTRRTQITINNAGDVGIGTTLPTEKLQVEGNISASGNIITEGHITASGNIQLTGGGIIEAPSVSGGEDLIFKAAGGMDFEIDSNGNDADDQAFRIFKHSIGGTPLFKVHEAQGVTINGHLTASGNISASGTITVDSVHTNHISASGNITASNLQLDNDLALGGSIFSFSGFSFIEGVSANFSGSNKFGSGSNPGANDIAGGGTAHQFTGSVAITGSSLTLNGLNILTEDSFTAAGISGSWQGQNFLTASPFTAAGISGSWQGENFISSSQTFLSTGIRGGDSIIDGNLGIGPISLGTSFAQSELHISSSGHSMVEVETSADDKKAGIKFDALRTGAGMGGNELYKKGYTQYWDLDEGIEWHSNNRLTMVADNGGIKFYSSSAANATTTEFARFDLDTKRLGIGTSSPDAKLHVDGDVLIKSGEFLSWGTSSGTTSIEGSTASNKLQFRTDSSTTRMIITGSNVGIGTTTPSKKLHVRDSGILIDGSSAVDTESTRFVIDAGGSTAHNLMDLRTDEGTVLFVEGVSGSIGKVGIGTSTPDASLEINNTLQTSKGNGSATESLVPLQDSILLQAPSSNTVGATHGSITWRSGGRRRAMITCTNEHTDNDYKGISFYTQGADGPGDMFESMRIAHSGNVGIGSFSPSGSFPSKLHVSQSGNGAITTLIVEDDDRKLKIGRDQIIATNKSDAVTTLFLNNAGNISLNSTSGNTGIGTTSPDVKLDVVGDVRVISASLSYQQNTDVDNGTETIATLATGSYDAGFFDYVAKNGTNLRAGIVTAIHSASIVQYNEVSTVDIGDTSDVKLSVVETGGNLALRATTTTDNWNIKSLVRGL